MSLEASASSAARYCVRKVLSASRQHLDIGKHVTLGTADIVRCAPSVTGFDSRNLGAGKTTAGSVNLIRGNNSAELAEVRAEVERRLAHLRTEERHILMPVMSSLTCSAMSKRECCRAPARGVMRLRQGTACLLRRILTVYRLRDETMAFGLAGAPAILSKVMDAVLMGLRYVECYVYLDGILIVNATIPEHASRMRSVLRILSVSRCHHLH
jgi:uncharacterized protein YerC